MNMRSALAPAVAAVIGLLSWISPSGAQADEPAPTSEEAVEVEEVPGEIVADLKDGARPEELTDALRELGGDVRWNSEWSEGGERLTLVHAPVAKMAEVLARLRGDAHVEAAEENYVYRASFVPNDPLYGEKQWHLARVGAERA